MVDLGPLAPWSGPPDMAVPALERWHTAWERDHPELLGPGGPSFYRPEPEPQVSEAHPVMAGIRPSEVRQILREMGVPSATEDEIDWFLRRQARQAECRHEDVRAYGNGLNVLCWDCRAVGEAPKPETPMQKPLPPPGPGAATTAR